MSGANLTNLGPASPREAATGPDTPPYMYRCAAFAPRGG